MAGIMAALAAKEECNRVLIVEPSNVLGGQGTVGGVAGFCGDSVRVNVYFTQLVERLNRYGLISAYDPTADRREYDLEWCAFFLQEMVAGKGIDVLFHSRVVDVRLAKGRVEQLMISTAGGLMECDCGLVVDASGQCVVASLAGFPVIHEGANKQLPMSLYFTLWDSGKPVKPFLPPDCVRWENEDEIPMTSLHLFPTGKVEVKMKVVGFDAADGFGRSQAEIHARRHMMSLIYFLQTRGYGGVKLDRHVLASVSRSIGIREEKRIVGEHFLTEEEASSGRVFEDAVAVGTYHFDYHWPDKMERAGTGITTMIEPYHIPLSCMIPKGAKNLLVAGRSASGDQLAMSSFRVMATVAQMGFGAGHAARLCSLGQCSVTAVDRDQLRACIEAGGQSLNLSDYGDYLRQSLLTREVLGKGFPACLEGRSPSMLHLKNNRFILAWVGASREDRASGSLWTTCRYQGRWAAPVKVVEADAFDGNPFLFKISEEEIRMIFRHGPRDELNHLLSAVSLDAGRTWSEPEPLALSRQYWFGGNPQSSLCLENGTCLLLVTGAGRGQNETHLLSSQDGGCLWDLLCRMEFAWLTQDTDSPQAHAAPFLCMGHGGSLYMISRDAENRHRVLESKDHGATWNPTVSKEPLGRFVVMNLVVLSNDRWVLAYVPAAGKAAMEGPLRLGLYEEGETAINRFIDLEANAGGGISLVATQRGIAAAYVNHENQIAFWHGSLERITDPELVAMREKILHAGVVSMEA